MRKLAASVDTRNHDMPVAVLPDYINYYSTPDGSAIVLPVGTRFIQVSPLGTDIAWVATGGTGISAEKPSGDVADGTASQAVLPGGLLFEVPSTHSHFAVACDSAVQVSFWG